MPRGKNRGGRYAGAAPRFRGGSACHEAEEKKKNELKNRKNDPRVGGAVFARRVHYDRRLKTPFQFVSYFASSSIDSFRRLNGSFAQRNCVYHYSVYADGLTLTGTNWIMPSHCPPPNDRFFFSYCFPHRTTRAVDSCICVFTRTPVWRDVYAAESRADVYIE